MNLFPSAISITYTAPKLLQKGSKGTMVGEYLHDSLEYITQMHVGPNLTENNSID